LFYSEIYLENEWLGNSRQSLGLIKLPGELVAIVSCS
jgi:hypothetical protein